MQIRLYIKAIVLLTGCFCICSIVSGKETEAENKLLHAFQNARNAIARGDVRASDFWLTYCMALSFFDRREGGDIDLLSLIRKRRDLLEPTAFISGRYTESFLDFFVIGPRTMWQYPLKDKIRYEYEYLVQQGLYKDRYAVEIIAVPVLQSWYILSDPLRMVVIPLGSAEQPPYIILDELEKGKIRRSYIVELLTKGGLLHFVWPIEFYDLDGDGVSEVWIRYNVAKADGFSQVLDVYRIDKEVGLKLVGEFRGGNGGFVRRRQNRDIEVGQGIGEGSVLNFDKTLIEIWRYADSRFEKISSQKKKHILFSDMWQDFFFSDTRNH